jgi:hypothetical protein
MPVESLSQKYWEALAKELCFPNEKAMLETFYETLSIKEIARRLDCGTATIARRLEIHKIEKRKRGGSNTSTAQRYKLFHTDQRNVIYMTLLACSELLKCSHSLVYKYRKYKSGSPMGQEEVSE